MQLRPDIALRSMIKSLTDVVLPAVDPGNRLAVEQLQVAIGLMAMMEQRLPLAFSFDCDELRRLLAFAEALAGDVGEAPAAVRELHALATAAQSGAEVLDRAKADPAEVLAAIRSLREASGTVVTAAYRGGDEACKAALMQRVLAMSKEQLLRDRAWVSSQGWEPHPEEVPPIVELLRGSD